MVKLDVFFVNHWMLVAFLDYEALTHHSSLVRVHSLLAIEGLTMVSIGCLVLWVLQMIVVLSQVLTLLLLLHLGVLVSE